MIALFIIFIILILIAAKFNWEVSPNIIPIFFFVFLIMALSMFIISMSSIYKIIEKQGIIYFLKRFIRNWLVSFALLYLVGFLKKDIDIPIIFWSSFAITILSNYYIKPNMLDT